MNKKYFGLVLASTVAIALAATSGSILPAGVGTYSAWTPSTGTTHYTLVDEITCNGNTDYVSTATAGARDSYAVSLASIPDGSTITDISITPCAGKAKSTGTASISAFYRLNGVSSADGAAYSLTATTPANLSATNYTGLSTLKSSSTTLEVGTVYVSGTQTARLSRVAAVITYTPPVVTIPADPTNLTGVLVSSSTFNFTKLTWTDNSSNEVGFKIERGTDGVNFTQISSTTANVVTYSDLPGSGTFYYRVRASNSAGDSGYTGTVSVTLP